MNEELRVIITAEIDELKKQIKQAQDQVENFAKKGEKGASKFGAGMKKAAGVAGKAMKAVGAAVIAAGAAVLALSESTREFRDNQAKLATSFEVAGASAEVATQTYEGLYRVLGDDGQATEAAQHLSQLTTNQAELSEWTNICQGVYATFGESLPIESLTEAANETAKTGELTGALADALNWAGVSEDDFKASLLECNSEAEREALIRDTLNGLYSDAAATYEENAANILSANEAQLQLTQSTAALGAAVEPIATLLKVGLAGALTTLTPHLETVAAGITDMVNGVDGGAEKIGEGISNILTNAIGMIVEFVPKIIDVVVAILPQITGALLGALPLLLGAIIQIATNIIQGIADMLPEIVSQVVEVIPLLIEALVANFPALLNAAIDLLMAIVEAIPLIIPPLVNALPRMITSILNALVAAIPVILDGALAMLMAIVDAIPQIIPSIVAAIPKIIDGIVKALIGAQDALVQGSIKLLMGIITAIPQIIPPLVAATPQIITTITQGLIKAIPQLMSSSKEAFMSLVKAIPQILPNLLSALGSVVQSVKTNLVEKLKSALKFNWQLPKIKMPSISVVWKDSPGWLAEAAKFIGLQGIPSFSVSWNAAGGVFDKPTLFNYGGSLQGIGEAGAEAVVPLENNLEWLNKLADMLNDRMGGGGPIVLQVDGKTFAQTSIRTINQLTKQNGKLGLQII